MYIEKEFSITTKLASGRYIDVLGDQLALKTRLETDTQKWYFDFKSRTVINKGTKKSMGIQNSGSGKKINTWKTTSEWF
jgi:hypothetical protein